MILRLLLIPLIAVLAFIALGGALSALAGIPPLRGRLTDVGDGRRMHIISEGPWPHHCVRGGCFGFSADWGVVQQMATAQGWHSCAYDRAGMGLPDAGDTPHDAMAVTADLHNLLALAGETGPYLLVGHSMAGIYLPLYAKRWPDQVAGLVLCDATTRVATTMGQTSAFIDQFTKASRMAAPAEASRRGYYKNVETADHRTLLGLNHGRDIIAGIAKVRAAL